ncbi:hypothetical protein LPJ53_004454, partial [Coemansia erecta]
RGIMDDLESMFYVVLHILGCRENRRVIDFLGCTYLNNELAAMCKIGAMSSRKLYLKMAGIEHCPANIKAALDKLHERLFFVDGEFIGPNLVLDDKMMESKRKLDDAFVADFIGDAAFKEIFGHSPGLPALQSIPTTAQPVDDDVVTDVFTATLVLSRSTSTSRKRPADDDAGHTTPKRSCP